MLSLLNPTVVLVGASNLSMIPQSLEPFIGTSHIQLQKTPLTNLPMNDHIMRKIQQCCATNGSQAFRRGKSTPLHPTGVSGPEYNPAKSSCPSCPWTRSISWLRSSTF